MMEIQVTITGLVQGVGFRDFVQNAAEELSLTGYVQNKNDGSVFVCAQGEPEALRQLVEYLHEGSPLSRVDGVAAEWGTVRNPRTDFSIAAFLG
jgi:acylphosphatase